MNWKARVVLCLLLTLALTVMLACGEKAETETAEPAAETVEKPQTVVSAVDSAEIVPEPTDTVETETGLKYIDIKVGEGEFPKTGQNCTMHYTLWLEDGTRFQSSKDSGQPFTFLLGQGRVIKAWDEAVATMKKGGVRKIIAPPALAYGPRGSRGIPPNATLTFEMELLDFK